MKKKKVFKSPKVKPLLANAQKDTSKGKPTEILAEFKKGVHTPLNVERTPIRNAPPFWDWSCKAAWKVVPSLEQEISFQQLEKELGNTAVLYHGTQTQNIADIAKEGLQPGKISCMFGSGIYLAQPAKAIGYASNGTHVRYLLQVKVVLGRVKECEKPEKWSLKRLRQEGFDSVAGVAGVTQSWGGTLYRSENVVYSPQQVMVTKIFEYQKDERKSFEKNSGCEVLKSNTPTNLTKKNRAFKDLLSWKACAKTATTQVHVSNGSTCWVCNTCIQELKMQAGTQFRIKGVGGSELVRVRKAVEQSQ